MQFILDYIADPIISLVPASLGGEYLKAHVDACLQFMAILNEDPSMWGFEFLAIIEMVAGARVMYDALKNQNTVIFINR